MAINVRTKEYRVERLLATHLEELHLLPRLDVDGNVGKIATVCLGNVYKIVSYPRCIECQGHCGVAKQPRRFSDGNIPTRLSRAVSHVSLPLTRHPP